MDPNSSEIKVCATLQALRWRVTKSQSKIVTKQMIYLYMDHDILDCSKQKGEGGVLETLLGRGRRVLEYTMTLMNSLASECLGRTYLLKKTELVEVLVRILNEETSDTPLR